VRPGDDTQEPVPKDDLRARLAALEARAAHLEEMLLELEWNAPWDPSPEPAD